MGDLVFAACDAQMVRVVFAVSRLAPEVPDTEECVASRGSHGPCTEASELERRRLWTTLMGVLIEGRIGALLGLHDASKAGEVEESISTWFTTMSAADRVQFKRMRITATCARL